jgi:tRNA dimethylallyltransferase
MLQYVLTMDREVLYARADRRIDLMIETGFAREIQTLLAMGYSRKLPSMSGLGYAQLAAHLEDQVPLSEAIVATKIATHKFIRHQYTWFRKYNQHNLWHNVEQVKNQELITQVIHWLKHQD